MVENDDDDDDDDNVKDNADAMMIKSTAKNVYLRLCLQLLVFFFFGFFFTSSATCKMLMTEKQLKKIWIERMDNGFG